MHRSFALFTAGAALLAASCNHHGTNAGSLATSAVVTPAAPGAPNGAVIVRLNASPSPDTDEPVDFTILNASGAGQKPRPDCTPFAGGKRYDVGTANIPKLDDVPWGELGPGDVVCVPYRPEPYRAKIYFITRGAPGAPIRLVGQRGPHGERPIIDGDGATTSPAIKPRGQDAMLQQFGVISLLTHFVAPMKSPWGWHPGWITITGLKIQHARPQYKFTDASGKERNYPDFAAGIYINPGDNVVIEDCDITDSQLGVFAKSFERTAQNLPRVTENLTLRGNYIHDNSDPKLLGVHNVYIEGRGCNTIGNFLGHKPGLVGSNFKSRCAHERIYGNTFVGGYQGLLSLLDPQSGWDALGNASDFEPTVVAGNVLVFPPDGGPTESMIHFGGDSYSEVTHYRKKLILYANTIVARTHTGSRVAVLGLFHQTKERPPIEAYVAGNVIANPGDGLAGGPLHLSLAAGQGGVFLDHNWVGSDITLYDQYAKVQGQVTGWEGSTAGADPGFAGGAGNDVHPAKGSALVDKGLAWTAVAPAAAASSVNDFGLYEFTGTAEDPWYAARTARGAVDLGAYEALP